MKKSQLLYILPLFLLTTIVGNTYGANYYWVGGTGNWSDYANHWATSSGGSTFHIQVPQSVDNVFFDANSFTASGQTITIDKTIVSCLNMNWTGVANNPQFTVSAVTNVLDIYGSLTFVSGMSIGSLGPVNFRSTIAGNTIATAALNMNTNLTFDGAGGWTLQDDMTLGTGDYNDRAITLNNGSLNTNGKTVTVGKFLSNTTTARTLTLGASTINVSYFSIYGWDVSPGTNLTLNAGTSTINMTCNISGWSPYFRGGGKTYNNLYFTGASSKDGYIYDNGNTFNGDVKFFAGGVITKSNTFNATTTFFQAGAIQDNNTFYNLTFSPGYTYTLTAGKTQTITGTFSALGNCTAYIAIESGSAAPTTISKTSGVVTVDYTILTNIAATGGAAFTANHATDKGGNTGWTLNLLVSQDLYWIGDGGNWSDGNHWSATSGGAPFGCVPGINDNVFFDANSFSADNQSVTIDLPNANCKSMTWTGVTHNPKFQATPNTNALNIYGSLTLVTGMSIGAMGPVNFRATTMGNTITTAGQNMMTNFLFDGVGGGWTLLDDLTLGKGDYNDCTITLNNGNLNTNDKTVTVGKFLSNTTTARTLTLGASIINISYFSIYGWDVTPGTNLTLNSGTSTINMTCNIAGWSPYFKGGGKTYYNVFFTGALAKDGYIYDNGNTFNGDVSFAAGGVITKSNTFNGTTTFYKAGAIQDNNTFNNLIFSPGYTYTLTAGKTQTITGSLSSVGTCTLGIAIQSSALGSATTISKSSGTVTIDYTTLTDIAATGGAVFTANHATNVGGNSGWTINLLLPQDLYWIGNGGDWSDGNHWSTTSGGAPFGCAPGKGDNVFFDVNSFSSDNQIVNIDLSNANCKNMTWTGVTHNPKFQASLAANALNIYGSLTLAAGMTIGNPMGPVNFRATAAGNTITTAGQNMMTTFSFDGIGGEWTLLDDLTLGKGDYNDCAISLNNGILNTNDKTVTVGKFWSNTSTARTLNLSASTINVSYFSIYGWDMTPGTNLTLNAGTSTINMTCNIAGWSPYFKGGSKTYNNVRFTGALSKDGYIYDGKNTFNGEVRFVSGGNIQKYNTFKSNTIFEGAGSIMDSCSFNNLTFSPGFTYTLSAGRVQTIHGALNISGTGGFPVRIQSNTAGTPAIFYKESGVVCVDYIRLSDNTATGGAAFYAGANSEDMGGNTGWSFTAGSGGTAGVTLTATPSGSICSGTAVQFSAAPVNGGTAPTYQWKKNGTDIGTNTPDYADSTLVNNDVISCTMTSSAGCVSAATVTDSIVVSVVPGGTAGTISAVRDTICSGTPVSLQLTGSSGNIQWQSSLSPVGFTDISGANTTTYMEVPAATSYYRTIAGSGTCSDTSDVFKIVVNPSPVADFSYTISGMEVHYTDASTGASAYEWNFGDGITSSDQNPVHTYTTADTFHVCLNVFNGSNCSFTICKDVTAGVTGMASLFQQNNWKIYPTVTDGVIHIKGESIRSITAIELYDVLGRSRLMENVKGERNNTLQINLYDLPEGVYYLKIKTDRTDFVQPIIKTK